MHSIFDFNEDKLIDELDAYCFYYTFETENPELFMSFFYDDWMSVIARIIQKKRDKGYLNRDHELKMKKIQQKLDLIKKAAKAGIERFDSLDAREQIRKFVFDEFMKKDPDEISFERPDSGSGAPEDSSEESSSSDEIEESEEEDLKFLN